MPKARTGAAAFVACSVAIFWPGAFIFGFPGVLGPYWQQAFEVGRAEVGKSLFFVLTGAGSFMYLTGRWQERLGFSRVTALGAVVCGGSAVLLGFARGMGTVYAWAFLVGASSAFIYIPGSPSCNVGILNAAAWSRALSTWCSAFPQPPCRRCTPIFYPKWGIRP